MGDHHRLTRPAIGLLLGLAAGTAGSGCKHEQPSEQAQRRVLLTPPDTRRNLQKQREKQQVLDAKGNLIPSDQVVAGIVMPRGLELYASSEHDWDFKAHHVPADALERYFAPRLLATGVTHSLGGAVTFEKAQPKDNPKSPLVQLRIVRLRGELDESELFLRQAVPGKVYPSGAEAEAQLQARRAHAE